MRCRPAARPNGRPRPLPDLRHRGGCDLSPFAAAAPTVTATAQTGRCSPRSSAKASTTLPPRSLTERSPSSCNDWLSFPLPPSLSRPDTRPSTSSNTSSSRTPSQRIGNCDPYKQVPSRALDEVFRSEGVETIRNPVSRAAGKRVRRTLGRHRPPLIAPCWRLPLATCRARRATRFWCHPGRCCADIGRLCVASGANPAADRVGREGRRPPCQAP